MLIKKIIFDEGNAIKKDNHILCVIINDKGENEVKFISKTYLESMNAIPCSSSMFTESISKTYEIDHKKENADYNSNSNYGHRWNEKETKYLLDQYRTYFPQIGPYRVFKNKIAMFEQISKDLFQQCGIKVTVQQCLNRFKNVNKQKNNALSHNKVSGNTPTKVPYKNEFEEIKSIDDSLKPEVLLGVNHMKINEKIKVGIGKKSINSSDVIDTERDIPEKPRKKLKTNTLVHIIREISVTAVKNRDRRHKEKCDLLISLLGKPAKNSDS